MDTTQNRQGSTKENAATENFSKQQNSERSGSSQDQSWGRTPIVNEQDQTQGVNPGGRDNETNERKNETQEEKSSQNTSYSASAEEGAEDELNKQEVEDTLDDESDFPEKGDSEIETPYKKEGGSADDTEKKIPIF